MAEREKAWAHGSPYLASMLRGLADELGTTPAALAVLFALSGPRTASVLLGATSPEQLDENLEALELMDRLSGGDLRRLRAIGAEAVERHCILFGI